MPGSGETPVVVSIIDDHPDLCSGVLARLPQLSESYVPGVMAATVPQFMELDSHARRSDVILLDLTLRDQSSPARNVRTLKNAGYRVVIYTGEERPERLHETVNLGADALVRKDEAGLLTDALRAVVGGDESWISPLMAAVILDAPGPGPRLSDTQIEILRLYATGITAQQIASLQGRALATVKSHLKEVRARYQAAGRPARTRTELLAAGIADRHIRSDWYRAVGSWRDRRNGPAREPG